VHALRLFLAIDIPNSAREQITAIQNHFKALKLDVTWVKPANIHLTVKFLGNTDPGMIPGIKDSMANIARTTPPFFLHSGGIGVFPSLARPRVLWVGLEDPKNHLDRLKNQVENAMSSLGFPPDNKDSVYHLTLGRIKSPRGKERLRKEVESNTQSAFDPFEVSAVKLIKSELTAKGSIYTVLEEFVFNRSLANIA